MIKEWVTAIILWILSSFKTGDLVTSLIANITPTPTITEIVIHRENVPLPVTKINDRVVPTNAVGDTVPSTFVDTTADKWGVSKQIDEDTWTMKIGMDARMATAEELFNALNTYRQNKGSQKLTWDENLANFAQDRAEYLSRIRSTDGHKGFQDYLKNEDGYSKLGFNWLGENISYGYRLEGVHLIEWMYAGDKPHDDNQLDSKWDHVGIGIKDTATCIIFATAKR